MKLFLSLAVLSLFSELSLADATLVFVIPDGSNQGQEVSYLLKDNILRINQADAKQYKLYDKTQQALLNIDRKTGNISRIDSDYLNSRVATMNKQRLQKMAEVELQLKEKLKAMSAEEKRIAKDLVAQLKYPEFYGAHTFLKVEPTKQTRTIQKIKCSVYNISRNQQLLKQLCMASQQALKLSDSDYATLRSFYQFNYTVFTRLRIAMGKTDFIHVDYEQENMVGIPIEVLQISDKNKQQEIFLTRINHQTLDKALFNKQAQPK